MEHDHHHKTMDAAEHERWNEEMARKHDPDAFITRSGLPIRIIEGLRLERARKALDAGPEHDVLDVGCGPGNLLERLAGRRVVGVDLSDTLLAQARLRATGRRNVEVLKANAERLPFPDASFDRVVCSEVLEHVRDPQKVVDEIRRVCRPGARVVFTVPNEELINFTKRIVLLLGLKQAISGEYHMSDDMLDAWHLAEISAGTIRSACAKGFRETGCWSVPLPLFAYHRVLRFEAA